MVAERSGSTENARAERFDVIDRDRQSPDLGALTPDSKTIGAVRRRTARASRQGVDISNTLSETVNINQDSDGNGTGAIRESDESKDDNA